MVDLRDPAGSSQGCLKAPRRTARSVRTGYRWGVTPAGTGDRPARCAARGSGACRGPWLGEARAPPPRTVASERRGASGRTPPDLERAPPPYWAGPRERSVAGDGRQGRRRAPRPPGRTWRRLDDAELRRGRRTRGGRTVLADTMSRSAISALVRPSASSAATSSSRRGEPGRRSARVEARGPRGTSRAPSSRSRRAAICARGRAPSAASSSWARRTSSTSSLSASASAASYAAAPRPPRSRPSRGQSPARIERGDADRARVDGAAVDAHSGRAHTGRARGST